MILDGYWKKELRAYAIKLRFWSRFLHGTDGFIVHQLNKNILYSAIVIRKIFEDDIHYKKESDKKKIGLPEMPILQYKIDAIEYSFIGDEEYITEKLVPENYKFGIVSSFPAKDIANYIIHAFVWNLAVYLGEKKDIGFAVSSDRNKTDKLYFVRVKDWIDYILFCIENSKIYMVRSYELRLL